MTKILRVKKPFDSMEAGDTFELSKDGRSYISEYTVENEENSDAGSSFTSKYTSSYTISDEYAEFLVNKGVLVEVNEDDEVNKPFVNVFDEIDEMLDEYTEELKNIDESCADLPACLKIERETVLTNICAVLTHLKSLKK